MAVAKKEKKATVIRKKHVAHVTHKPALDDAAADNPPLGTLDDSHGRAAAVAQDGEGPKTVQHRKPVISARAAKKAPATPYDEKLEEVRRDLSLLAAKLRTHGIHVTFASDRTEPEIAEDEEV